MSNKKMTPNMMTAMARAALLLKVLDLEIDATTTDLDLRLMAERLEKECRERGLVVRDTLEFLKDRRADAQAEIFRGGDA